MAENIVSGDVELELISSLRGPKGDKGEKGDPGPTNVPTDTAVAALLRNAASDTGAAVRDMYGVGLPSDIGAVGDGVADDTAAIQAIFRYGGHIPAGNYSVSNEIKWHDNAIVTGAGEGVTVIRMADGLTKDYNLVTNALNNRTAHTTPNRGMKLSGVTLDRNWQNTLNSGASGEGLNGSVMCLACVEDVELTNVTFLNGWLHGLDIASSEYTTAAVERGPGPSMRVRVIDCTARNSRGDDGFTTHHSGGILIQGCKAYGRAEPTQNQIGFEIDDGSFDVRVVDCYSYGWASGFQAKGHGNAWPAWSVTFENCVADTNAIGFYCGSDQQSNMPNQDYIYVVGLTITDCTVKNSRAIQRAGAEIPAPHARQLAVHITNWSSAQVRNLYVEDCAGGQVVIDGTQSAVIDGLVFRNCGTATSVISRSTTGVETVLGLYEGLVSMRGSTVGKVLGVVSQTPCRLPVVQSFASGVTIDGVRGVCPPSGVKPDSLVLVSAVRGPVIRNLVGRGYTHLIGVGSARFGDRTWYGPVVPTSEVYELALNAGITGSVKWAQEGATVTIWISVSAGAGVSGVITSEALPFGSRPGSWTPITGVDGLNGSLVSASVTIEGLVSASIAAGKSWRTTVTYVAGN